MKTDEAPIRELIKDRVSAIRAKDINQLMANHAADVLLFDVVDPLQYSGAKIVRQRLDGLPSTKPRSAARSAISASPPAATRPSALTSTALLERGLTK